MVTTDYLPKTDNDLLVWLNSFRLKFATYGPTLGFTTGDVAAVNDDYNMLAYVVSASELIRNESQARTSYQNVAARWTTGHSAAYSGHSILFI